MAGKNGKDDPHDLTPEIIDRALALYDAIKNCDDVAREPVEIPEWKQTVYVQTLTGDDRDDYEQWVAGERRRAEEEERDPNLRGIRARVAVWCVVDVAGNHLFTDSDREWLGKKSAVALDRIFVVADRLSKLTSSSQEEIRGNSLATPEPGVDSPTP